MIGSARVAGVVVCYHPPESWPENVRSFLDEIETLFVVDNSEPPVLNLAERAGAPGRVVVLAQGENLGIARALNSAAEKALEQGFDFLLTMDQDSRAEPGMVMRMLACLEGREVSRIGMVTPCLVTRPGQRSGGGKACREVLTAMTSGSLLNLAAFLEAGPFLEELFIDFVDIEYCLRLRSRGFRILRAEEAILEHRVGSALPVLAGAGLFLTTHVPVRKYYKTRNRFLVGRSYRRQFPGFVWRDRFRFILELLRLLLFEPGKKEKLRMMWHGFRDYRRGKFGKYEG